MKLHVRRPRRLIAAVLAGALALTASPLVGMDGAGAADAAPPPANPIAEGAFCDGAPADNPFTDLGGETSSTRDTILCLVATGVSTGKTATQYQPSGGVTRRQMALFIKRLADLANELETSGLTALPAYDGTPDYTDLSAESPAVREAVGQLSQAGIVMGTTATRYSPAGLVTRRQMAAFVNRLQDFLTGAPFTANGDYFDDDNGDPGEDNLNAMAERGIFQGDGAGNVFPGAGLTRRQMALILMRDAQVLLDDGNISRAFGSGAYTVDPGTATTLTWIDNPESPTRTSDDRQYVASGLEDGTTYKIALFPAANVITSGDTVLFVDADGAGGPGTSPNRADGVGATGADILVVNGTANSAAVASAQATDGVITFTVDGDNVEETVIPVVWLDHGPHVNQLDLVVPGSANSNPKEPSEAFGIGGAITYVPEEAAAGTHTSATVVNAYPAVNYFTTSGDTQHPGISETFYYDQDDVFQYQPGADPASGITLSAFESMLSRGDVVSVSYEPEPQDVSTFTVTSDAAPTAPAISSIAVKNLDGDPSANDVEVTFTPPATNADGVTYQLQRGNAGLGPDNTCRGGDDTEPAQFPHVSAVIKTNSDGSRTFTSSNLAGGCYDFRIFARNPVSETGAEGTSWIAGSVSGGNGVLITGGDVTGPLSEYMDQSNGAGAVVGTLDNGDTITIAFNEAILAEDASPFVGDSITFTDGDGTVVRVTCGGGTATCSLNTQIVLVGGALRQPGTVFTIMLTQDPTPVDPGTVSDLAIATGVASSHSGVTDTSNNAWNISGSPDKSLA